jgi:hypothetical protein
MWTIRHAMPDCPHARLAARHTKTFTKLVPIGIIH